MSFDEILQQALDPLKRQGRVSYRALKRRFDIDDDFLDDLKEELLYVHAANVQADDRLAQDLGIRLSVRVGIHTGLVVRSWLTEGVGAADLQDARALLEELTSS